MVSRDPYNVLIAVYMMANKRHGTIYIGVSSELITRVGQHREGCIPGFTRKFDLKRLVWFEPHERIVDAIRREKLLKKYKREWKINLIERDNPYWVDLFPWLTGQVGSKPDTEFMGRRDKPGGDGVG